MPFTWKPALALGHDRIDEDHQQMFAIAGILVKEFSHSATSQEAEKAFSSLFSFAREHFAYEETLMRSAGYLDLAYHTKVHSALLVEFQKSHRRLQNGAYGDSEGLVAFIQNWLFIHIETADREFVEWLKKVRITPDP